MYKLDLEKKKEPNFLEDLAIISCELLLAYEELSSFNETRKMAPNIEPKAHFMTQKQTKDHRNPNLNPNNEIPSPYPSVQKVPNVPTNLSSFSNTGQPPFSPGPANTPENQGAEPRGYDPYNQYPNKNPTFNNPPQPNYPGPDNPNYYPTPEFNQSGSPVVPPRPGQLDPNPNPQDIEGYGRDPSNRFNAAVNLQKEDHLDLNDKAYYPNQPGIPGQNAPTPGQNFNPYPASNNNERDAGNFQANPGFSDRNAGNYPLGYNQERNAAQFPPNSGLSDRNAGNYPPDYDRERNAAQFPPNSGSSDRNAGNFPLDYDRERIAAQYPPNSGSSDRNAGNFPLDYNPDRNASQFPPNFGSSDRNAGNYQPKSEYPDNPKGTSEKPMQNVPSSDGMKHYENKRDGNREYPYHEPPHLHHSISREGGDPPTRPIELVTSIRDGTADEYSNTPSSSTSIQDPTSKTPFDYSQVDRDGARDGLEQLATSKTSGPYDSGAPKIPKPGESGSMGGVPSFFEHEKLGIHSHTPRGSPSGSSGQNQARPAQEMSPIEEGSQGRNYNQPPQTPVDPIPSANPGENKGKPMIPPPTKIDDKFKTSAFTENATKGLYEPKPSIPTRMHPDSGKQMPDDLYSNREAIFQNEQERMATTQGYPPGGMGQRNTDRNFEHQHNIDQKEQFHYQGSMNRAQYSGPQQPLMGQHHTGDIGQTGESRGFEKGPQEQRQYYEQGNTGRTAQLSGPQQTQMGQHHTGEIAPSAVDKGFGRPQDQSPYYDPGNMARDQQPLMGQHHTGEIGQTGGIRCFERGPQEQRQFYEQGNTGRTAQYSGPQQTPMGQHHTGEIGPRVDKGFGRPQDQSPHYDPGNMARDQQPLMGQHGDMDPRSVAHNDPRFYDRGNVPQQQLPSGAGMNQYEPRQPYSGRQDSGMFQNPETAPHQRNIPASQHNVPMPSENLQQMPRPRLSQPGNPDNYSSYVTPRPPDTHDVGMRHQIRPAMQVPGENYQMQGGQQQYNYNDPRIRTPHPNYPPGNPDYAPHSEPYQATGQIQTSGNPNYPPEMRQFQGDMGHMHDAAYGPTGQQPPIPRFPKNPSFSQPVGPNSGNEYNIPNMANAPDSYRADERYQDGDYAAQPQNYPIGINDDLQHQRGPHRPQPEPRIPQGPWACKFCTLENPPEIKICGACSKSRDFNLEPPTSQMKECEVCRKLNPIGERTCQSCRRQIFDDIY